MSCIPTCSAAFAAKGASVSADIVVRAWRRVTRVLMSLSCVPPRPQFATQAVRMPDGAFATQDYMTNVQQQTGAWRGAGGQKWWSLRNTLVLQADLAAIARGNRRSS